MKRIDIDLEVPSESRSPNRLKKWSYRLLPILAVIILGTGIWFFAFRKTEEEVARDHLLGAQQAYDAGDYEEAAILFKHVIRKSPENPAYRIDLALCYYRLKDRTRGREELEEAIRIDPGLASAHLLLAEAALAERRWGEAQRLGEEALRLGAREGRALRVAAKAALRLGDVPTGAQLLHRALKADPGLLEEALVLARQVKTIEEEGGTLPGVPSSEECFRMARRRAEALLAPNPNDRETEEVLARALAGLGEHAAALPIAEKLRKDFPKNPTYGRLVIDLLEKAGHEELALEQAKEQAENYADSGSILKLVEYYLDSGDREKAKDILRRSAANATAEPVYPVLLGSLLVEDGAPAEAEQILREALGRLPDSSRLLMALGALLQDQGDAEGALGAYRKALDVTERPRAARRAIAAVLVPALLGEVKTPLEPTEERLELANEILDPILEENPDDLRALRQKGMLALARGEPALALKPLDHLLGISPGNREASYYRGAALLMLGRPSAAADALADSLRGEASPPPHRPRLLLSALTRSRRFAEAHGLASALLAAEPNEPALLLALGRSQTETGRPEEAARTLRKAVSLSEKDVALHLALARALTRTGKIEDALAVARGAREIEDSRRTRRALADLLTATGHPDEAAAIFADNAGLAVEQGDRLLGRGDLTGARTAYEKALTATPGEPEVLARLADVILTRSPLSPEDKERFLDIEKKVRKAAPESPIALYLEARKHLIEGNAREAEPLLARVEATAPSLPLLAFLRGTVLLALGDNDAAIDALSRADESGAAPEAARELLSRLLLQRAMARLGAGGVSRGVKDLERAVQAAPGHAPTRRILAEIAFDTGRGELGEAQCHALLARNPGDGLALYLLAGHLYKKGEMEQALRLTERFVRVSPKNPEGWLRIGILDLSSGKPKQALEALEKSLALAESPLALRAKISALLALDQGEAAEEALSGHAEPWARLLLADAYLRLKRPREAESVLRELLRQKPPYLPAATPLFGLLSASGRPDEPRTIAEDLVKRAPGAPSLDLFARQQIIAMDVTGATKTLEQAIEADPDHHRSLLLLAEVVRATGKLEDAQERYRALAEARPKEASLRFLLGQIAQARGRPSEAKAEYESALGLRVGFAPAASALADLLIAEGGREEEAERLARAAVGRDRANPWFLSTLGKVLLAVGEPGEARGVLERAVPLDPGNPEILFHLGSALSRTGRAPEARQALEKALALTPERKLEEKIRTLLAKLS